MGGGRRENVQGREVHPWVLLRREVLGFVRGLAGLGSSRSSCMCIGACQGRGWCAMSACRRCVSRVREVSCGGPACVLFALVLKFWSQGGALLGAFACGVGGFARASLMVKAWRCGNLADAGVGGLGFDGGFQTNVRFARDLIVKSEAVHKSGARWRRPMAQTHSRPTSPWGSLRNL